MNTLRVKVTNLVKLGAIILLIGGASSCFLAGDLVEVETRQGTLVGSDNGAAKAFLGVRYAKPPIGDRRWAEPEPLEPSALKQLSLTSGPGCLQGAKPTGVFFVNEDCLYLDIWAPSKPGKYPVMVWFHGGGLQLGSGSEPQYRGERLAEEKDVIVIGVNYRLSFMGYLASPELTAESGYGGSGNQGFLDMVQALRWVQQEIASFGGDPDNVTIFGESGGAIGVCNLVASPLTEGLFHKTILQSGSCRMLRTPDLANAETKGQAFFAKIGCDGNASPLACARDKTPQDILAAIEIDNNELFLEHPDDWAYYPTSNLDNYLLPMHPVELLQQDIKPGVSFLIGTNKDEGTMFIGLLDHSNSEEGYLKYLQDSYGDLANEFMSVYPLSDYEGAGYAAAAISGDGFMDCPAKEMAGLMAAGGHTTYVYQFVQNVNSLTTDLILQVQKGKNTPPWGTFHSADIPYVFGVTSVLGYLNTEERKQTNENMMSYWTNFAKTGNPNDNGLPVWPEFKPDTTRYIQLGGNYAIESDLKPKQCDFWLNTFFAGGYW